MSLSNLIRVNEYRRTVTEEGATIIQMTGHGVRVIPENITRIYTAGMGYEQDGVTDHNIFTVFLVDGTKFITDWAGVDAINQYAVFVRVNEYKTRRSGGVTRLQATDHGMRVVAKQVTKVYTAGLGFEINGIDTHECFTVHLADGGKFITDWDGQTLIDNLGV
jgi:hypothetical protein